jgi:hypothetical protein
MNNSERQCYLDRYPDVQKIYGSKNLDGAQTHWEKTGCNQVRNNQCPGPQSTSGAYTFQGCFKSQIGRKGKYGYDTTKQMIPIEKKKVKNIDECRVIAEQNNKNVFGIQNGGICFIGDDIKAAKDSEFFTKDFCGNMGGNAFSQEYRTNQVYIKNSPIPQPISPVPELGKINFGVEKFENFDKSFSEKSFFFILFIFLLIIILFIYFRK